MKVIRSYEEYDAQKPTVVTMGTFDGVHLGHQAVLAKVADVARRIGGHSLLLTFFPHPRMVLYPKDAFELLQTIEERQEVLAKMPLDYLLVHPFDKELSRLTAIAFVRDILVAKLNISKLIIGHDHRFGKGREGNFDTLKSHAKKFGFEVIQVGVTEHAEVAISSTKIRKLIAMGEVMKANVYLGRYFNFSGLVVHGKKLGRKLGFPTANIQIRDRYKMIPCNGVYAVRVLWRKKYRKGMMNIGHRPTMADQSKTIEVHLFDFDWDLYGQILVVDLLAFIRKEKSFPNMASLKQQLIIDQKNVLQKIKALHS